MVIDDVAEFLEKKRWTIDWPSKRKKVDYRLTHQHIYIYIYICISLSLSLPLSPSLPPSLPWLCHLSSLKPSSSLTQSLFLRKPSQAVWVPRLEKGIPPLQRVHVWSSRCSTSGKCKVLIFLQVWYFYPHALYVLSADDFGRFLQNPTGVDHIVGGQNVQSMRDKRSDPQKD